MVINMAEKFLPIGTVCQLKGTEQKVAITGFCMKNQNLGDRVFDYVACYYPQGVFDPNKNILFDHDQIEEVVYMGFINEEEKAFKQRVKEALSSQNLIPKKKEYDASIFDMNIPVGTFVNEE